LKEITMEAVVDRNNLIKAYKAIRRNQGGAGLDGRTIKQTVEHLRRHWAQIEQKLLTGRYVPSPLRGVQIPKANGGQRRLGIPTVQDRIIQQAVVQVMSAQVDESFSEHSYGYRPGRSAHDAIKAAQSYLQSGKSWTVDLDISAFFDQVNHDILMHRVGQVVRDKRLLRVIGRYLRAGIVMGEHQERRTRGTPQGGPLSPLLANLYLDPLDKELERRGLSFCRYADDINIYVSSQRSAERVLGSISRWIEKHLKLQVNRDKSGTGRPWESQFLGFTLLEDGRISMAQRSIERLKGRVRELWDARQSLSSEELVEQWRSYLRGWCQYFRLAEARWKVKELESWMRRHMRKCFWLRWHNREGRWNALKRLGAKGRRLKLASSRRGAWRIASSPTLHLCLDNKTLYRYGLWIPSDFWATSDVSSNRRCGKPH
jgi:RNA-directed DNA polymerase